MVIDVSRSIAPVIGEAAPDSVVGDGSGAGTRLSALWTAAPRALVLVFLRHFG